MQWPNTGRRTISGGLLPFLVHTSDRESPNRDEREGDQTDAGILRDQRKRMPKAQDLVENLGGPQGDDL